ncbi:hypothetical protein BXZ70DRAFT_917193 [Cristinia sonorae]|uniref:Uncharacterized protein n=1 Tax=Cristinia sonorae TaxID=1940300 RepID=A0A8K0XTG8_9AGAR|nr:hypothetical protein BXZ70DRAFT_917193 [Cristinia sonorae]
MSDSLLLETKLSLPAFLQVLTSSNVTPSKAISVAGKIYKTYNTRAALAQLTDSKLKSAGVTDKDERKLVLAAIKKAGYTERTSCVAGTSTTTGTTSRTVSQVKRKRGSNNSGTTLSQPGETSPKKKLRRGDTLNGLLPDHPIDEGESYGSLDFNEILDETVLMSKSTVINRAPIMTAWSFVVAERLGFQREEALSIATVYTEMNAISKGVSLGIYDKGKEKGVEASKGGSQPYVDLMGRSPLYQTATEHWRALSGGTPVSPSAAYSYITRTLRQTAPQIVGALRLLGTSYSPTELNEKGYSMYLEFRPNVDGWGKKGEVKCSTILALRGENKREGEEDHIANNVVKVEAEDVKVDEDKIAVRSAPMKTRGMTLEEYEAALDAEDDFDDLDLNLADSAEV